MTHKEKELYAAMVVYYLVQGKSKRHVQLKTLIATWRGSSGDGVNEGIKWNVDITAEILEE